MKDLGDRPPGLALYNLEECHRGSDYLIGRRASRVRSVSTNHAAGLSVTVDCQTRLPPHPAPHIQGPLDPALCWEIRQLPCLL